MYSVPRIVFLETLDCLFFNSKVVETTKPKANRTSKIDLMDRKEGARRPKPQVSCTLCKSRKLKCDRKRPCGNCHRRPPGSCIYVSNIDRGRQFTSSTSAQQVAADCHSHTYTDQSGGAHEGAYTRTTICESFDVESDGFLRPDSHVDHQPILSPNPSLSQDSMETRLIDNNHWETVLKDIDTTIFKFHNVDDPQQPPSAIAEPKRPFLLFAVSQNLSFEELVNSLPPKSVIDKLVNLFTRGADIPPLPIHLPTFLSDYVSFWENPNEVSFSWLSILFSVITLALQFVSESGVKMREIPFIKSACNQFASRAAECLRLSDYAKPKFRAVEAMTIYLLCEHFWLGRDHFRASLILGLSINLAMRSGYHRDPSHYSQISVFEGEIRRRSWSYLVQLDLLFASYLGLPPHISYNFSDTALPSNIADEDLHPAITCLPPCQPPEKPSTILFLNYRLLLAKTLAQISEYTTSLGELSYDDILDFDRNLDDQVKTRPPWLQDPRYPEPGMSDEQANLNRAMEVEVLEQRARIILHRKFLLAETREHLFSRERCVGAATRVLQLQAIMYKSSFDTDGFKVSNWRALSLMSEDFLLGGMIICLVVVQWLRRSGPRLHLENSPHEADEMCKNLQLLKSCVEIFTNAKTSIRGIERATSVIHAVLSQASLAQNYHGGENRTCSSYESHLLPLTQQTPAQPSYEPRRNGLSTDFMDSFRFDETSGVGSLQNGAMITPEPEFLQGMLEEFINGSDLNEWNSF